MARVLFHFAGTCPQHQNGCATLRTWSAFLGIGSPRHWRCAAVSCGTATQGWRSASRCGSRTRNAPTDKRTALPRTPRVVWPSSTLSSPLADETRRRAVPECVGQGVLRSKIAMCKYWFKTPWLSPLFGRMARLPKGVPAWCGMLRGPWPTGSMREERPCHMPVTQPVGLRRTRSVL
jgi:hypothetical protein